MDMEENIKNYLEEQCKIDPILAEKYNDSRSLIRCCIRYINEMAREELGGKSGAVKDDVVFHWAREYYVDGTAEKDLKLIQKQLEKISDLSNVKINKDIPEERKERMRQNFAKAMAELHQQEFVELPSENGR